MRIRMAWWRAVGERLLWAAMWLYGHFCHWRERNRWIREDARVETLEMWLARIQILVGLWLCFSPDPRTFDSPATALMSRYCPVWAWGGLVLLSGLCNLIGLMEWDSEAETAAVRAVGDPPPPPSVKPEYVRQWEAARLRRLMILRQFGLLCGGCFWFGTWLLLVAHFWFWWGPWIYLSIAQTDAWLFRRVGGLFVQEEARQERLRRGLPVPRPPSAVRPARGGRDRPLKGGHGAARG